MRMIRLKHAKEILKKGRYNVSEVAYMVGFGSSTYFSTCYAEHYGYAPSEELR
jgi:transcriptional regulator GlxA family with amidase domain